MSGFGRRLDFPYCTGVGSTALVPLVYPVALAGHPFMLDTNAPPGTHQHASIPYLRPYFLTSGDVGEQTLTPESAWRRTQQTWHKGAGQKHLDNADSDRARFRSSKGVDVWTRGQIALLQDTVSKRASANTNLKLITVGSALYLVDGAALKYTTDLTTWSDTGIASTVAAATSDGYTVWAGISTGVRSTTRGAGSTSAFNDLVPDLLGYAKGRLMAAKGASLYNLTWGYLPGAPTGLAVVTAGAAGATHYSYRVSAVGAGGETLACTEVTVTTGNATLSGSNYNVLSWNAVSGATSYKVYGRTTGAELFMVSVSGTSYNDTGTVVTPAGALPAADSTGSAPAALFTHPNSDWVWVGFTEGDSCIYAAGWSGDRSAVFRIPIKADGTGLDVPIQAGELPNGETALTIRSYAGLVFVGTTLGVRTASQSSTGDLSIGSVIPVGPVRCASGYDRFVWFGWENYDTAATGLGRLDVTVLNDDAPAYATDVQASAQGRVLSVVTFNGARVFAVSGVGVFTTSANLVASGTLDTGTISYDLPDPKVTRAIDVRHTSPLVGTLKAYLSADEGAFVLLGQQTSSTSDSVFDAQQTKAEVIEVRLELDRSGSDTTSGPTVHRYTTLVIPAALSGETLNIPLLIRAEDKPLRGQAKKRDPAAEVAFLKGLRTSKETFIYQEGARSYSVTMTDYQWTVIQPTPDKQTYEGTFLAVLQAPDP